MPRGDCCAVWAHNNDCRYLEKQNILPLVGILRLAPPRVRGSSRVASLRTHAQRNILKVKQFRILPGVIC